MVYLLLPLPLFTHFRDCLQISLNPRCVTIFLHTPSVTRGPFSPPPGISGSGNPVNLLFSKVIKHAFRSLHTKSQVKILRGSGDMDENVILLYCYLYNSLTIILNSKHLPHMMSCVLFNRRNLSMKMNETRK